MQKKLIALAVAGVASTAAFAQSNVTIYGTLNPSFDSMKVSGDNGRRNSIQSNNSNIGFKGEENLGNGLKAIFQIESGVGIGGHRTNADLGGADGPPQAGVLGGRNTFVGLKGGFGEVTMGRRDTAFKSATGSYDPFADTIGDYNNIIGQSTSSDFNTRANSSVNYISPKMAGFVVSGSYSLVGQNATTGQDDNIASGAVNYAIGGLSLVGTAEKQSGSAISSSASSRNNKDAYRLGAMYKFGPASVFGLYENIKQVDTVNLNYKRSAYHIGGTYAIGAIDLMATYIDASAEKGDGAGQKGAKNFNLGARYNLSKRTNVLAVYSKLDNEGDTTTGGNYAFDSNNTGSRGLDATGFSVRVQHKF